MNQGRFSENIVEQATLAWLESLDYELIQGANIAPDSPNQERKSYSDIIIEERLLSSLTHIRTQAGFELKILGFILAFATNFI